MAMSHEVSLVAEKPAEGEPLKPGAPPKKTRILILGDWVVDEYWFLVSHHSDISSHIGFTHYRSSLEENDVSMDLCGAGHVARMLHQIEEESSEGKPSTYEAWGLGVWNSRDENFLYRLLLGGGKSRLPRLPRAFFRQNATVNPPANFHLINLDEEKGQTIHVVRLYYLADTGTEQLSRIDWEPPLRSGWTAPLPRLEALPEEIDAIVVYDLRKGVVTEEIVDHLATRYPDASWYVRSKNEEPGWLAAIESNLKLILLGPEILSFRNPWGSWLIGNRINYQAKELLDKVPDTSVVLLLDSREVIALDRNRVCLTVQGAEEIDSLSQVGWSSAFFTSLIFSMLSMPREKSSVTREALEKAMESANSHMVSVKQMINPTKVTAPPTFPVNPGVAWTDEAERWRYALQGLGTISLNSQGEGTGEESRRLEVWRGCTALPGYVCCIPEKRDMINRIGRHLRSFRGPSGQSRPISIMLQADPGTGKTFLAKSLARMFNFELVKADVTQMLHREDLLDLFDSIATKQANQDRPVLIFVDEVNALLDTSNVYGAFLAPLEEGSYVRRGSAFNLKPCVWIFAGTDLEGASGKKGDKVEDFKSRMTMIAQFDYESLSKKREDATLIDDARLEQVYLGASLIRQLYPDVRLVSESVLKVFHKLDPAKAPARTIRKLIRLLRSVQYGKITEENCRPWEIPLSESPLVELVFEGR
jgi:hypothetical protein